MRFRCEKRGLIITSAICQIVSHFSRLRHHSATPTLHNLKECGTLQPKFKMAETIIKPPKSAFTSCKPSPSVVQAIYCISGSDRRDDSLAPPIRNRDISRFGGAGQSYRMKIVF